MRLLLATKSDIAGSSPTTGTLRADAATSCGDRVEIPTSSGGDEVAGGLLALVAQEDRPPLPGRPWVMLNMVTSADGATAGVEGRSASLSGEADRQLFRALRSTADVILAGATTVRAENYGAPRVAGAAESFRRERNQAPLPRLAVVTGSLRLDPRARLFQEATPEARPIVLSSSRAAAQAPERLGALQAVADVHQVGDEAVDWSASLRLLRREYDVRTLLVEGGPTTNAQLVDADLVDELGLTVSPLLVGGSAQRILAGVPTVTPRSLVLDRVLEDQGFLLLRYLVRHPDLTDDDRET